MAVAMQNSTVGSGQTEPSPSNQDNFCTSSYTRKSYVSVPSNTAYTNCPSPDFKLIIRQLSISGNISDNLDNIAPVSMVTSMKDVTQASEDVSLDTLPKASNFAGQVNMETSELDSLADTWPSSPDTHNAPTYEQDADKLLKIKSDAESTNLLKNVIQENALEEACTNTIQTDPDTIKPLMPSYSKTKIKRRNDIKSKRRKMQGRNKKWKDISLDHFGFELSLFPWQPSVTEHVTAEMDIELKKFEEDCVKSDNREESDSCDKSAALSTVTVIQNKTVQLCDDYRESWTDSYVCGLIEVNLQLYLNNKTYDLVDQFTGNIRGEMRLRSKRKWQIQKAGRQIKTKYCREVTNTAHGVWYYIHHRVVRLMHMVIDGHSRPHKTSIRAIDKAWNLLQEDGNFKLVANPTVSGVPQTGITSRPFIPRRDRPTPPPPAYALSVYNADGNIEADLVNILVSIQDRDLTPEDYELLLRLDDRVQPKCVDEKTIENLRIDVITEPMEELCAICLEEYVIGRMKKYLPCGHYFHSDCTDQWLKNSTRCPLDGLEIAE